MATDLERLIVSLEARITQYERAMQKALGKTNTTARGIERRFRQMNSNLDRQWGAVGRTFLAGISLQGAQRLIDTSIRIQNSLKVAGLEGEELTAVYDRLFAAAQRNAAPIESLAELYGRAALVQKELGVSSEELADFTDRVALALRVSGKSASESSGALLQLSQALGSGVVRAEEFNSILEGAPAIAQAAAAGLKEAGGSVAALRNLVVDGKVSSEAFFRAFEAGSVILEDKVAGAELTVSQAFVRLQNVLIDVAGKFNEGTGASNLLADGLSDLGDDISSVAETALAAIGPISDFIGWLQTGVGVARDFAAELARISGLEKIGLDAATAVNDAGIPGISAGSSAGKRVLETTFAVLGETPQDQALLDALNGKVPPEPVQITVTGGEVTPVSISDYAAPSSSGSGRGGRSAAISETEKQAKATKELIADLQFEGEQIGRTAVEQEVMNNLRRANTDLMSEEGQRIADLTRANYDLQQSIEHNKEAFETWRDASLDAISSVISALDDGKIDAAEFGDILISAAAAIANLYLPGSGQIVQALGGLFKGKRASGGPVSPGGAYLVGERGPELFAPRVPGTIIPNHRLKGGVETIHVRLQDDSGRMAAIADQRIMTASGQIVRVSVAAANKSAPGALMQYQADRAGGDHRVS